MGNEPVAWIDEINTFVLDKDYRQLPKSLQNGMIPLYTHPVKKLTDEEINMLAHEYNCIDDYPHEFVRACIRKAQEK